MAKYYGPPLTGYPGSSGNQTMEQMLEGMKSTLSSKQSDPRPFIHIKVGFNYPVFSPLPVLYNKLIIRK